jgi:hypothetical protein
MVKKYIRLPVRIEDYNLLKNRQQIFIKDLRSLGIKEKVPMVRFFGFVIKKSRIDEDALIDKRKRRLI